MTLYDEVTIRNEVDVIRELANGLHEFLGSKTDADLGRQSACAAWTVRDVAGHLTNRAERQIASMTRGRAGDSAAPEGFSAPSDNMAMSAANADVDVAYTQSMGDTLLPIFELRYQELSALLDSFSGDEWHSPCWHPRRGAMTAREYVSQRIQELAVHDWDMRSAFDPNAGLYPDAEPALLGMVPHWLRTAYNPSQEPPEETVRYRFDLSDAPALDVVVNSDGVAVGSNLHPDPDTIDAVVSSDTNTFLLLAYGRLKLDVALVSGRIRLGGGGETAALLHKFARWMKGF